MEKKTVGEKGEITVFLSLILVCTISLLLGVLESARTAGARLYLRMSADSAMDSLMSQYNRNLWEMYRLLFLEYETSDAVRTSYEGYLAYYLEQKNFYPMKQKQTEVTKLVTMEADGAEALEEEILAYVKYRLPDVAANLSGIMQIPEETAKAGDFRELLKTCRQVGKKTRKLEKARKKAEDSLKKMQKSYERICDAASEEREGGFRSETEKLIKEMKIFPEYVKEYGREKEELQQHLAELKGQNRVEDQDAAAAMSQEIIAYTEAADEAERCFHLYADMEKEIKNSPPILENALEVLAETGEVSGEDGEEEEPDWESVRDLIGEVSIPPGLSAGERDEEKAAAVDRLEELLDQDLLTLILPEGTEVSGKKVSLNGIPSLRQGREKTGGAVHDGTGVSAGAGNPADTGNPVNILLVNEYIFLYFDSFIEKSRESGLPEVHPLSYEQEYLVGGKASDRENLKSTAEQLLAVRGALNLLYLLSSSEKRSSAETLAASISAGSAPVQIILSFFILSLWAFGESILDLRTLFDGGKVSAWKSDSTWRLGLEELLSLEFLHSKTEGGDAGYSYEDYMRVLLLLQDRQKKNFRLLDLIEWNVRTGQSDFRVKDCAWELEIEIKVLQRHMFFSKEEYETSLRTRRTY